MKLHHSTHSATTGHLGSFFFFSDLRDNGLCRQEQACDRCCVLKSKGCNLCRVDCKGTFVFVVSYDMNETLLHDRYWCPKFLLWRSVCDIPDENIVVKDLVWKIRIRPIERVSHRIGK